MQRVSLRCMLSWYQLWPLTFCLSHVAIPGPKISSGPGIRLYIFYSDVSQEYDCSKSHQHDNIASFKMQEFTRWNACLEHTCTDVATSNPSICPIQTILILPFFSTGFPSCWTFSYKSFETSMKRSHRDEFGSGCDWIAWVGSTLLCTWRPLLSRSERSGNRQLQCRQVGPWGGLPAQVA